MYHLNGSKEVEIPEASTLPRLNEGHRSGIIQIMRVLGRLS